MQLSKVLIPTKVLNISSCFSGGYFVLVTTTLLFWNPWPPSTTAISATLLLSLFAVNVWVLLPNAKKSIVLIPARAFSSEVWILNALLFPGKWDIK